jgi:hypothetical protein
MPVPLAQLAAVDPDESTAGAIGDWHYWVAQGHLFSPDRPSLGRIEQEHDPTSVEIATEVDRCQGQAREF